MRHHAPPRIMTQNQDNTYNLKQGWEASSPNRARVRELLHSMANNYAESGLALPEMAEYNGHIHVYLHVISSPSDVIHIQGYPELSDKESARLYVRLLDHDTMEQLRRDGAQIGKEYGAMKEIFKDIDHVSYDPEKLEEKIAEKFPKLRVS